MVKHNAPIYVTADFLDCTTGGQWGAVVASDGNAYLGGMPVPKGKKWLLPYIYQPFLTQQLGYYGDVEYRQVVWSYFAKRVASRFPLIDYTLKASEIHIAGFTFGTNDFEKRVNQLISLYEDYEHIASRYRRDRKRDIQKLADCILITEHDAEKAIEALHQTGYWQSDFMTPAYVKALRKLLYKYVTPEYSSFFYLTDADSKNKLACGFFPVFASTVYNFVISKYQTADARYAYANLIDRVIRKYAGQLATFDMEGSSIAGVQDFFASMGAYSQYYYYYRRRGFRFKFYW